MFKCHFYYVFAPLCDGSTAETKKGVDACSTTIKGVILYIQFASHPSSCCSIFFCCHCHLFLLRFRVYTFSTSTVIQRAIKVGNCQLICCCESKSVFFSAVIAIFFFAKIQSLHLAQPQLFKEPLRLGNCQLICCESKSGTSVNPKQKMSVYNSSVLG